MTSIIARIAEDEEEYQDLCIHFNESPVYKPNSMTLAMYGPHAESLRQRRREELVECRRCDGEGVRFNNALEKVTECGRCRGRGVCSAIA